MSVKITRSFDNINKLEGDLNVTGTITTENLTVNGTYTPGPGSNIMTTNTVQTVTAQKNHNANINLGSTNSLQINGVNAVERDSLNIHNAAFTQAWQLKYETNDLLSFEYVTSGEDRRMVLNGVSGLLGITDDNSFIPTASLHVKKTGNSILNLESSSNNSEILFNPGSTNSSIINFKKNSFEELQSTNYLDLKYSGSHYFRADGLNKNFSMGLNASPISRCILNIDNANGDVLKLPTLTNAQESTLPNTNGFIFYNTDDNEITAVINGVKQVFHHKGTTDITAAQITDVSADTETATLLNKTVDKLQMQSIAPPTHNEGLIFYDQDNKTLSVYNENSDINHNLGQEGLVRVYSNGVINNGQVCYVSGVHTDNVTPLISLARADNLTTTKVIGIATCNMNNSFGYVTYWGFVNGLDTQTGGFSPGDILYLSSTVAGAFTNVKPPVNGNYNIELGYVIRSDLTQGRILVEINADLAFETGEAKRITLECKKDSPGTLNPFQSVFIVGWDNSEGVITVELSDNTDPNKMPCIGILVETVTNNTKGKLVVSGKIEGLNTNSFNVGDSLYVSTLGTYTNIRPTGNNTIQVIATVVRKSPSNGVIEMVHDDIKRLPNATGQNHILISDSNFHFNSTLNNTINTDLISNQTIGGLKTFSSNVNTQGSYLINGLGTLTQTTLTLVNGSNVHSIECVGTLLSDKISFKNAGAVECMYMNSSDCVLNQNHSFNLTLSADPNGAYRISGNDALSNNKLRLNNLDVLDITTNTLTSNITQSSLTTLGNINQNLNLNTSFDYRINNVSVLNNNTLGSGITNSSLTTLGNINQNLNLNTSFDYRINNVSVLNNNTLGSGITNSSLTTLGNINQNLNLNTTFEYRINGTKVINANSLGDAIVTCKINQTSPANNIFECANSNIHNKGITGSDSYIQIDRSTGENFRLITKTDGFYIRNQSAAVDLIKINNDGIDILQSGDVIRINGTQVLKSQESSIANPANDTTSNNTAIISILGALRNHGIIAT